RFVSSSSCSAMPISSMNCWSSAVSCITASMGGRPTIVWRYDSALAFERQQLARHALIVDLITAISNGLFQPGNTLLVDGWLIVQLLRRLLQALCFKAQLNVLASGNVVARDGSSGLGWRGLRCGGAAAVLYVAAAPAGGAGCAIGAIEVDNHGETSKKSGRLPAFRQYRKKL